MIFRVKESRKMKALQFFRILLIPCVDLLNVSSYATSTGNEMRMLCTKHVWTFQVTVCETHKLPYFSDLTRLSSSSRILLQNLTVLHPSHPNSLDPFYIILPSMPRYSKWPLSFRFPHQNPVHIPFLAHICHMHHPACSLSPRCKSLAVRNC